MTGGCLNCGNTAQKAFCEVCGQKTSTHRFSFSHIFSHDFLHGVFHVDKGLLYTIKELMVRPGHTIREYIQGKRVRHFNYFTLIILILSVSLILKEFTPVNITDLYDTRRTSEEYAGFIDKLQRYPKILVLITIPLYSVFSWLIFRKAHLNFAEHLVINSYRAAGEFLIYLILSIAMVVTYSVKFLGALNGVLTVIVFAYSSILYYQFFSVYEYARKFRRGLRSLLAASSPYLLLFIIGIIYLLIYGLPAAQNNL